MALIWAAPASADLGSLVLDSIRPSGANPEKYVDETVRFADMVGKHPIVLLYWSPAVNASVDELVKFDAFVKRAPRHIRFFAVARAYDAAEGKAVRAKVRELRIGVRVVFDPHLQLAKSVEVSYMPAYYGVDADGSARIVGFHGLSEPADSGDTLERILAEAAKGRPLPRASPKGSRAVRVGDVAPDFTLTDLDGAPHRLGELVKRPGGRVLLLFWSPYCPHCRKEVPRIERYVRKRKGAFRVLAIAPVVGEEDRLAAARFVTESGLSFPVLLDGGGVAGRYGVRGVPTWMVMDEAGKVLVIESGEKAGLEGLLRRWER